MTLTPTFFARPYLADDVADEFSDIILYIYIYIYIVSAAGPRGHVEAARHHGEHDAFAHVQLRFKAHVCSQPTGDRKVPRHGR